MVNSLNMDLEPINYDPRMVSIWNPATHDRRVELVKIFPLLVTGCHNIYGIEFEGPPFSKMVNGCFRNLA